MGSSRLTIESLTRAHVTLPDHVVHRAFEVETVLLNLSSGRYHGVDNIGGRILSELIETGSPERAAAALAAEYGQSFATVAADVVEFCNALADRDLIKIDVTGE